jgi:DNA-directed RNA polymerase subunit RPC12/RpoP
MRLHQRWLCSSCPAASRLLACQHRRPGLAGQSLRPRTSTFVHIVYMVCQMLPSCGGTCWAVCQGFAHNQAIAVVHATTDTVCWYPLAFQSACTHGLAGTCTVSAIGIRCSMCSAPMCLVQSGLYLICKHCGWRRHHEGVTRVSLCTARCEPARHGQVCCMHA